MDWLNIVKNNDIEQKLDSNTHKVNKRGKTMKYILSDIKKGYKIKTIMKRHDISATLVIACMNIIQRSS